MVVNRNLIYIDETMHNILFVLSEALQMLPGKTPSNVFLFHLYLNWAHTFLNPKTSGKILLTLSTKIAKASAKYIFFSFFAFLL